MQLRLHSAALQEALDDVGPIEAATTTISAATMKVVSRDPFMNSPAPLDTHIVLMLLCMHRHNMSIGACWRWSAQLQSLR